MICYVDGSCQGNGSAHSKGGFGVVILDDNENLISVYQHHEDNTTNNRQEMKAILWALINYGLRPGLTIVSDSAYAVNTFSSWMYNWARNGWLKSDNKQPENLDLVQAYYDLVANKGFAATLQHIKGHNGNKWNEVADKLATGKILFQVETVDKDSYILNCEYPNYNDLKIEVPSERESRND